MKRRPNRVTKMLGLGTARELSERTGVGVKTVYRLTASGLLPCLKIGSRIYYDVAAIARTWGDAGKLKEAQDARP